MSRRRAARRPTVGLVLVGLALALLPGSATAEGDHDLVAAGWWWRAQAGLLVTVEAPQVPDGGIMVAGAPDGATAVAALRFELGEDDTSPILTLQVASDQGGEQAQLAACLAGSPWIPANTGRWEDKPSAACDAGSVSGVRSDDGSEWSFALEPLLVAGLLDVVLVPGKVDGLPPGADGSTFQLAFEPPTTASLMTTPGTPPSQFDFDSEPMTFTAPPAFDDGGRFDDTFALPPPPPARAFEPSLDEEDQEFTAIAPSRERLTRPQPVEPIAEINDPALLGILVLLLAGAAAYATTRQPAPAPRRLGRFAASPVLSAPPVEPTVGGLGRFARPRTTPAPRL